MESLDEIGCTLKLDPDIQIQSIFQVQCLRCSLREEE
jgi:hypothetical protein